MCEHDVWIEPIQLEIGTINAIFICVSEIKQLAIKIENELGTLRFGKNQPVIR